MLREVYDFVVGDGVSKRDGSLVLENRLTRIESLAAETRQIVFLGLSIMTAVAWLLVKQPIDRLTTRVEQQNGRVTVIEHQLADRQVFPRIDTLEKLTSQLAADARLVKALIGLAAFGAPIFYYLLSRELPA